MKGLRQRLEEKTSVNFLDDADPTLVRDYYQSVLDSVGSVVYTVNRDLRIMGVNQQWDDFALANGGEHLTREHVLGSYLLDHMTGVPLERWRTACQQILDGQRNRYLDEVDSNEPHPWRHFSLTANPLQDSRGEILGITFVATNITQLKKAEHEMFQRLIEIRGLQQVTSIAGARRERRKVYKQITADIAHLFDAAKCVIFLWDENSGDLQAQEPAFGLAGRKLADLSLDMGHPADPDALWTDLEERDYILLNEGDEAPTDMMETSAQVDRLAAMIAVLRVSGRVHGTILIAGRDHPFSDQDGQLLALMAVPVALSIENAELNWRLLDRTQQLATTRDELQRVVEVKEAIRMPLAVVRGYLELFLEGALGAVSEGQRATMRTALTKTQAITSLVDQITPPQLPRDATRHEQIHLPDLVQQVLDERVFAIKKAGLELVTQLPQDSPQMAGDPDMLFKVFDALVDNAIKFSPSGGTLSVSLQVSNDILSVEVADPGLGISTDQLAHIWQPRKRAVSSGAISLDEVKRIVEGHGGQVWVESKSGQGSAFYVALRALET